MASKSKITVHEKSTKRQKGVLVPFFKTIKTKGTPEDVAKVIQQLKISQSAEFEVRNTETDTVTVYKKLINSGIYEVKDC